MEVDGAAAQAAPAVSVIPAAPAADGPLPDARHRW